MIEHQRALQDELEAEPVSFLTRGFEERLDAARARLASFLGAGQGDIGFVRNATEAVNSVVGSWDLRPGDAVLTTDHEYNASRNAVERAVRRAGAELIVAHVPFPLRGEDEVLAAIESALTPSVRFALLDHVTSPTAVVIPLERIAALLHARGIEVVVDGAHAPGMLDLHLGRLGVAWYAGNLHKWVCAPKGAAFLYVRPDRQESIRPAITSHGANADRRDRSRFLVEFDWTGTFDPSPWLCVPVALDAVASQVEGGWPEVRRRNHALALTARDTLCAALRIEPPAPDAMLGSMAALPLPEDVRAWRVHDRLFSRHRIDVPVFGAPFPAIRVSAQLYNRPDDYDRLAAVLPRVLQE